MQKRIAAAVESKLNQWATEAILFNAAHGRKGGQFTREMWANGRVMVGPVGCLPNQCITEDEFHELFMNDWKWSI